MPNVSTQPRCQPQAVSVMSNGIIYMFVFSFLLASSSVALSPDGEALISLKALLRDPIDHLANWNQSDADPCRWNGVKCQLETRRVHMLILPSKRLRGSISPAIGKLDQLRRLNLHSNQLYGPIPKELGNCSALRYLYLHKNYLTGDIPTELGKLKLLKALNLGSNGLTGTIPRTIGSLSRLDSLNVSSNYLVGKIPTEGVLGNFTLQSFLENPGLCGAQVNFTCQSEPPAPAPDSELISVSSPPASPPISPPSYFGGRISPAQSPSIAGSEAGGSIPEPLISVKRNVILISAVCIAVLSFLVCFWCGFLTTERGTDEDKNLEGYYGPKVVKFHGNFLYTSTDIIKRTNLLDEKDMIGSGGFGTVYRLAMDDGNVFAVKKIGVTLGLSSNAVLERELKILGSFKHRNLVNLRSYCITPSAKLLIYDYLPRGNLAESLHDRELQQQEVLLTWAARMKIATGAARGLAHLHHACFPPIVHSDIKSSNILLDENLDAHLSDFGLAKLLENNSSTVVAGTFGYLAPEYMDSGRGTEKGDVYSFGVVLLELLSGRRPTESSLLTEGLNLVSWVTLRMKEKIQCEIFDPKVLDGAPKEQLEAVLKIAVMCINAVAEKRPTMNAVLQLLETISCSGQASDSITNSYRSPHSVQEARGR